MILRSRLLIALIATVSFPIVSFGTDTTMAGTSPRTYTETETTYIRGLSCDTFAEAVARNRCLDIKNTVLSQGTMMTNMVPPTKPVESSGTPMTQLYRQEEKQNEVSKLKPPMMELAPDMKHPLEGLKMAISQLSVADRDVLVKVIREYLTSKGVDLTKYAEKREEMKEIKKDTREEIKEIKKEGKAEIIATRTKTQESMRIKREEMRAKVKALGANGEGKKEFVGHVSLLK